MNAPRARVNRRHLLRGLRPRPAGVVRTANPAAREDTPGLFDLLRARRSAMGTYFEVRLPARAPAAADLACRVLDRIDDLEDQLSVYRDDSEVSRLNACAHRGPVAVEPGLFALLERAVALHHDTGGAYDVTAGALSVAWGFFKGPRRVPDPETLAEARLRTGSDHLRLDSDARTVAFDRPGVIINLGSIGKGYALDRAADLIRDHWWPTPALIHGGQSSLFALGSAPGTLGDRWEITLRNPFDAARPLGTIRLRNRGLGTSGASYQQFEANGRKYGHILDPRTGEPAARGPASVTVLAPTAAEADALSTAFYLLGADAAASYVESHPDVGAIFVEEGPVAGTPVIRTVGLNPDDFEVNEPQSLDSRSPIRDNLNPRASSERSTLDARISRSP